MPRRDNWLLVGAACFAAIPLAAFIWASTAEAATKRIKECDVVGGDYICIIWICQVGKNGQLYDCYKK